MRFVLGEVDEAIRLFTLGLQMNPRHVLLQFSMGNAFAMLGRKEEAARSFEATLRIQPDFTAAEQYLRTLRRELQQQWWPSWQAVASAVGCIAALAIVQRTVQFYAMAGSGNTSPRGGASPPGGFVAAGFDGKFFGGGGGMLGLLIGLAGGGGGKRAAVVGPADIALRLIG